MTAVTVVCDEKSVADKAATGRTLSYRAKRGRTMSAVPPAPFGSRSGQAFSKSVNQLSKKAEPNSQSPAAEIDTYEIFSFIYDFFMHIRLC